MPDGKIDRHALAARALSPEVVSTGRPPEGHLEETLAGILCALLERDHIAADDNFFALGGDSLVALNLSARANAASLPLPAAAVFQAPTVAALAATLADTVAPTELPAAAAVTARAGLMPIVHRIRFATSGPQALLSYAALNEPTDPQQLRAGVQRLLDRHSQLSQPIAQRGRLWRLQDRDTPPMACVISRAGTGLTELLAAAEAHIDLAKGQGVIGVTSPEQALLVAHAAVLDGQGLAHAVAEVEATQPPQVAPIAVAEFSETEWQALLTAAQDCRWWHRPEPQPSGSVLPMVTRRLAAARWSTQEIISHFAAALCRLSQAQSCVFDLESPIDELGPLCPVPVRARAGTTLLIGSVESYHRYACTRRQGAAGPGVLLQPAMAPYGADPLPCGVAPLYRICA